MCHTNEIGAYVKANRMKLSIQDSPLQPSVSRRHALRWTGLAAAGLTLQRSFDIEAFAAMSDATLALRDLAASKKLVFGGATSISEFNKNPEFAALFAQHYGILMPKGELQWIRTQIRPDQPNNFSPADELYEFASSHHMLMRGHALLYASMTPAWFNASLENPRAVMEDHIRTKAHYFKGRIHSWDVVNETILPHNGRQDGLRETVFLQLCGDDYIERAFLLAAEADPMAGRVISDFGLESGGEKADMKRSLMLQLLNRLIRKSIPVQYIGIQGHIDPDFDAKEFDRFLGHCISLGLKVMITEFDVRDQMLPADLHVRDQKVASIAREFLDIVLSQKETAAVLLWGLSDRYTSLERIAPRPDGLPVRPLPFDAELKPKPMVAAIAAAIKHAPVRA